MSLEVAGVWNTGVWATTVWADDVWREGEYVSATLIGNKMYVSYEERKMTIDARDRTMMPEYTERKMTV